MKTAARAFLLFLIVTFAALAVPALPGAGSPLLAAEPAAEAAAPAETAAEAEAAEEFKRQREAERLLRMAEAEKFSLIADETISRLPYPLNVLLGVSFLGITLWRYLAAAGLVFVLLLFLLYAARRCSRARRETDAKTPATPAREAANVLLMALSHPLKFIVFGLMIRGVSSLFVTHYHPDAVWFSGILLYIGAAIYFYALVGLVDEIYGARIYKTDNHLLGTVRPLILKCARGLVLLVAGMHIYQSATGQTMVSLLAGLGIGGLALALASQTTLQNLLGFASIALDKAFLVGDTVNIGDNEGTVEHIGMRSTVIRAYDGKAVVVPNNNAITSNIVNFSRRPYFRREIRIALSTANPYEKVKEAMELIAGALENHAGAVPGQPPVVRFAEYEPARFVIQALFWYDAQAGAFFDESSRVNLEICRRLSEAGVRYADRPEL